METALPSDSELVGLARQVDEQLNALQSAPAGHIKYLEPAPGQRHQLPAAPAQQAAIEQATGKPFASFWQNYKRHARRDLCLPGGLLYEQWRKWRDLQSKDTVKIAYGVLAGMGIPTASLAPVAVAASVFLLNVVLKVGIEAVCEGCAEAEGSDPAPPKKSGQRKSD